MALIKRNDDLLLTLGRPIDNPDLSGDDGQTDPPTIPGLELGKLKGRGRHATHNVVLDDGRDEVGFVISDAGGDRNETSFRMLPVSTPANPYVTATQGEFGGGFGQATFEENKSKYWRSEGVDTSNGTVVLGPAVNYAQGGIGIGAGYWHALDSDKYSRRWLINARQWFAVQFTTPATAWTGGARYARLMIARRGTPADANIYIYTNSSGSPGSVVGTGGTLQSSDLATEYIPEEVRIDMSTSSLASSTTYWLVIKANDTGQENHWTLWGTDNTSQNTSKYSSNGSSWTTCTSFGMFGWVDGKIGTNDKFTCKFFEYKGAMYAIRNWDRWSNATLWLNGWRGACDSNSADKTDIYDSTQNWANKITGKTEWAKIVSGPASGEEEDWRAVTSGASGNLACSPDWEVTHTTKDSYVVGGTSHWDEIAISGHSGSLRRITDVAVSKGMVFMMRGNRRTALVHREWNDEGLWTDTGTDAYQDSGIVGSFCQIVQDPTGGQFLWIGRNPGESDDFQPDVTRTNVTSWNDWTMNYVEVTWIRPAEWVAADADVTKGVGQNNDTVKLTVKIGQVLTCSVSAGGTGYTNGDVLTLVDGASSGDATVQVSVTGGVVTGVTSIVTAGYDYTTGVKTTTGGSGSACTINVTGLDSFGTGLMAYTNLVDVDGNAVTRDLRHMTAIGVDLRFKSLKLAGKATVPSISQGNLTLDLDDGLNCASPFVQVSQCALTEDNYRAGVDDNRQTISLAETYGAGAVASVGFSLGTAMTYSFQIEVFYRIRCWTDALPVDVGKHHADNITGMQAFGDPQNLWVFTEGALGEIKNNRWYPIPNKELENADHPTNGAGNEVHDVYLMFTWRGRLQRYFRQSIEDLGPDFPRGFGDVAGSIVDVVTYPGRLYVAVDGRYNGKSSVLMFKGGSWHEVYTGHTGDRIRNLHVQSNSRGSDFLWFTCGQNVMYVQIAIDAAEQPANSDYVFRPFGWLDTSWVYTNEMELDKLFREAVSIQDDAESNQFKVKMYYKVDDDDAAWKKLDTNVQMTPAAVRHIISGPNTGEDIRGNRIRLRMLLESYNCDESPVVRSLTWRMYKNPEVKYSYSFLAPLSTISVNLRGEEERPLGSMASMGSAWVKLHQWASNVTPLNVTSDITPLHGRLVALNPIPMNLAMLSNEEAIEHEVIQIVLDEL